MINRIVIARDCLRERGNPVLCHPCEGGDPYKTGMLSLKAIFAMLETKK